MAIPARLLMIGVDPPALEALDGGDVAVTVLFGASTRDLGASVPPRMRSIFVDDHKNIDAVLNGLYRAGCGKSSFDAVYAHDDPSLMVAAVVGQVLGARAVPPAVVALFRDKFLQKQRLAQAGVPVTRHALIDDIWDVPADYRMPFDRAVLKPVAGMATQSTFVVTDDTSLARVSQDCRSRGTTARTFVLEEFVDGEEWFADGIVSGGQVRFVSLGRYAQNCLTAVRERTPVRTFTLDPTADKWAYDLAVPLVTAALETLGLTDGVFHLEMFHDSGTGRVVFSECAARRAGGPIADQVRYKFGVDLADLGVRVLLQPLPEIAVRATEGVVASTFLPLVQGTLLSCPTVNDLADLPGVVHARIFVPLGVRVQAAAAPNTFGRFGEVTVRADDETQARQRLAEVTAWFAERVQVLPINSNLRELFADPRNAGFVHAAGIDPPA